MTSQRIAIMGAGAVGCYHGAMLARAGEQVTLIGRPALEQAVATHGLRLEKDGAVETTSVRATTDPAAVAGCDLVFLAVKSRNTRTAARAIAPHLAANATVVSLQNGISNAAILAEELPRPTLPAVVYVAVSMPTPGQVIHRGGGKLLLGDGPGAAATAKRLNAAQIPTEVSPDVETALWTKLTINCALNALSALTRQPYATIRAHPDATATFTAIVQECTAVAQASGITLPRDILDQVLTITHTMPGQLSSTAQDLIAGKPTEIDHLNGEITRRADALGLPAPLNRALALLVTLNTSP
ncbi:2-dehydropantoate 2-reductase [Pararhodobacter sp.]|uniref:ketopantoate reductase family protein n=1 Tax=Pararhodobacter sp. TaxID=2127056 RepID=UPI002B000195|nr:2-dehydropantoate 2-reductase [Pararhodobacter sp.]